MSVPSAAVPGRRDVIAAGLGRRGNTIALGVLIVLALLQAAERLPLQAQLRAFVFDGYQSFMPRVRASAPAVVVDIDEASLARYGQWPWPRSLLAQLVRGIAALDPAAIGLDILMPEPDRASPCTAVQFVPGAAADLVDRLCRLPSNDALLANALRDARAAIIVAGIDRAAAVELRAAPMHAIGGDPIPRLRAFAGALTSVAALHEAAVGHAIVSADTEEGILRRMPMVANVGGVAMPSLPIEMLRLASAQPGFTVRSRGGRVESVEIGDLVAPVQDDGRMWIHFGRFDPGRYVAAHRILEGTVPRDTIERRLVLVGVSGLGLVDYPMTALGERVPGVEVHAQVLESLFDGTTLARPHWAARAEVAVVLLLGVALIFGVARVRSMLAVAIVVALAVVLWVLGVVLFVQYRLLIDVATPALLLAALFGGMLVYALAREQLQRRALEHSLRGEREAAARTAGEVAAARRIQLGMVPDAKAVFAAEPRLDVAARMEPARDVGGDLYDCFMLDADRAFFVVGDVCGKGIPASLFMATSKTLCKSVALRGESDLSALIGAVNREIARDNAEMLFVTAFAAILDLRSGELTYTLAGHDAPYLAGVAAPLRLDCEAGVPLGIEATFEFPVARRQLAAGEFVCVVTDGVTEATAADGEFFGRERLESALMAVDNATDAHRVLEGLFSGVHAFSSGAEPADDITVLVFRWHGV